MIKKNYHLIIIMAGLFITPIVTFAQFVKSDQQLLESIQEQIKVIQTQIVVLWQQQSNLPTSTSSSSAIPTLSPSVPATSPKPPAPSVPATSPTPSVSSAPSVSPVSSESSAPPGSSLVSSTVSEDIEQLRAQIATAEKSLQSLLQNQILDKLNQGQIVGPAKGKDGVIPRAGLINEGSAFVQRSQIVSIDYVKKTFVADIKMGFPESIKGFGGKNKQKVFVGFEKRICKPLDNGGTCIPQLEKLSTFDELNVGDLFWVGVMAKGNVFTSKKGMAIWNIEANALYPDQLVRPSTTPLGPDSLSPIIFDYNYIPLQP